MLYRSPATFSVCHSLISAVVAIETSKHQSTAITSSNPPAGQTQQLTHTYSANRAIKDQQAIDQHDQLLPMTEDNQLHKYHTMMRQAAAHTRRHQGHWSHASGPKSSHPRPFRIQNVVLYNHQLVSTIGTSLLPGTAAGSLSTTVMVPGQLGRTDAAAAPAAIPDLQSCVAVSPWDKEPRPQWKDCKPITTHNHQRACFSVVTNQ